MPHIRLSGVHAPLLLIALDSLYKGREHNPQPTLVVYSTCLREEKSSSLIVEAAWLAERSLTTGKTSHTLIHLDHHHILAVHLFRSMKSVWSHTFEQTMNFVLFLISAFLPMLLPVVFLITAFPVFLAIKVQDMSRFYPGQKGYIAVWHQKEDTKDVLKSQECKTWEKLPKYKIEMLYILTFQVLSRGFFFKISCFVQVFSLFGTNSRLFLNLDR